MRKRIFKYIFLPKKLAHLILHITNKCNLRCKTCFVNFGKNNEEDLELREIEKIAEYLKELIWLDIGGGEPFLRKDLPDICAKFNANAISIPTNGFDPSLIYEMTKEIRGKTKAAVNMSVSIDGFEKTNDYIRGKGSFAKSLEAARLLKTIKGVRTKINTVLCEKNYDEIIEFMKFIRRFNFDFHSICFQRGMPNSDEVRCPSYEKLSKVKKDIFRIWATYDYGFRSIERKILKNYQRIMYEMSLRVIKDKKQIPRCLAADRHLVIYPNGDIAFCEMLKLFGNIREENIATLLSSKRAKTERDFIRKKKCYCYHNCNLIDNIILNPLLYPRLLKGAWK